MKSRLKELLDELNTNHHLYTNDLEQSNRGHSNEIYFISAPLTKTQELRGEAFTLKNETKVPHENLQVVLARPRAIAQREILKKENQLKKIQERDETLFARNKNIEIIQKLIQEKKLSTTFIQKYLSRGDVDIFSTKANCDLYAYLKIKPILNQNMLKNMIGQIVLAVWQLHKNRLVHRDIKSKNILVFYREARIYLELADLNELAEINENNRPKNRIPITFTPNCCAPEVKVCWRPGKHLPSDDDTANYNSLDLIAVDSYALGITLRELTCYCRFNIPPELRTMILQLIESNPLNRFSVEKILDNVFFGPTPEARKNFFETLEKECRNALFIDTFYVPHFIDKYDAFFLLPAAIKKIYMTGLSLDLQITHFREYPIADFPITQAAPTYIAMLHSIQTNVVSLILLIDETLREPNTTFFHWNLSNIREEVITSFSAALNQIENYLNQKFSVTAAPTTRFRVPSIGIFTTNIGTQKQVPSAALKLTNPFTP